MKKNQKLVWIRNQVCSNNLKHFVRLCILKCLKMMRNLLNQKVSRNQHVKSVSSSLFVVVSVKFSHLPFSLTSNLFFVPFAKKDIICIIRISALLNHHYNQVFLSGCPGFALSHPLLH